MHGYRGYLELVRPANVATALADVLAGYAVAGLGNPGLGWLLLSTACLYAGGVVLNDVFDRDLDRIERPERPIPSGRVSVGGRGRCSAWACSPLGVIAASVATSRRRDGGRRNGGVRPPLRRVGQASGTVWAR